jgi:hypothetical protein
MLDQNGNIKVVDLGTSEILYQLTHRPQEGAKMGNSYYVSPRQAAGASNLDFHADIYALGCLLYQALTGHIPFGSKTPEEARHAHMAEYLPDLRSLRADVPREMVFLIEKMLAKDTKDRFESWAAFFSCLYAVKAGRVPAGLPVAPGLSTMARAEHLDEGFEANASASAGASPRMKKIQMDHIPGGAVASSPDTARRHVVASVAAERSGPAGASRRSARDSGNEAQSRSSSPQKDNTALVIMSIVGGFVVLLGMGLGIAALNKPEPVVVPAQAPDLAGTGATATPTPGPAVPGSHMPATTVAQAGPAAPGIASAAPPAIADGAPRPPEPRRPGPPRESPAVVAAAVPQAQPEDPAPAPRPPEVAPQHPDLDVLAIAPETRPDILWKAGELNGLPKAGSPKSSEFRKLKALDTTAVVSSPEYFPQIISPGQTFKINLNSLPHKDARICMAVNAMFNPQKDYATIPADIEQRGLGLKMEEHVLFKRWIPAGHSIQHVLLHSSQFKSGDNFLFVENLGKEDIAFDAMWVEAFAPGPQIKTALNDAGWLPREINSAVEYQLVTLPEPSELPSSITEEMFTERPLASPPVSASSAAAGWAELSGKIRAADLIEPVKDQDDAWARVLAASLKAGMLPVVKLHAKGPKVSWMLWAQRYGPYIGDWMLSGTQEDIEKVSGWIQSRIEHAPISMEVTAADLMKNPTQPEGIRGVVLNREWAPHGGRTDMVPGTLRQLLWKSNLYTDAGMHHWLHVSGGENPRLDFLQQRLDADMLASTIMQWWASGGNNTIIDGAAAGGSFFPDGSQTPSTSWDVLRLLLDASSGDGLRLACNITPESDEQVMADTDWVAIQNSSEQVSVLIRAGGSDVSKTAIMTVPVPWKTASGMIVQGIDLYGDEKDPVLLDPTTHKVDADTSGGGSDFSLVQQRLNLSSLKLVTLVPAGKAPTLTPPSRSIVIPAQRTSSELLTVSSDPLPFSAVYLGQVRNPDMVVDRLSSGCQHQSGAASTGVLPAWASLDQKEKILIDNIVPWSSESDIVNLPDPNTTKGLNSVRLTWNQDKFKGAEKLLVWVRPRDKDGNPGRRRTIDSFGIGVPGNIQKVRLQTDDWTCLTLNVDQLKNGQGEVYPYLLVVMDNSGAGAVQIEFNGFVAYRSKNEEEKKDLIYMYMQDDVDTRRLLIGFAGKPGVKGTFAMRLPGTTRIISMNHFSVLSDRGNLDGPRTRSHGVNAVSSGKHGGSLFQAPYGHLDWNPATRVLSGRINGLPSFDKALDLEGLSKVFKHADWKGRHPADSRSLVSLMYVEDAPAPQ